MTSFSLDFYLVALVTLFFIALLKGAFGGGFALIGVPMLSLYIPPIQAAAIIAPLVCLMDIFALAAYPPRTWDTRHLKRLIPGALAGMAVGALLLGKAPGDLIGLLVGFIAVAFSAQWLAARFGLLRSSAASMAPGLEGGYFWGGVSGFTSLLAHAGGPPLSVYLLPQGLPKTALAGTQTVFFTVGNYAKLLPYLFLGQLDAPTWKAVALIAPVVPLGVGVGRLLHKRLDQNAIYLVCYLLVFLAGCNMVFDVAVQHL
ncbi:sulfite exporter TauE/SafE family protein [Azospirillum cavernae]|uniref:Probable membrane transporter protein n=1 Tax=Azospirillum cavernae TaxID=2320860 RepID=A0A418VZX2_9PROT|nr:sulfite exporter TauE/SafE family protein [Azospirillum cavernae]RJF83279.1 sulfite exporter TauE/SafE family protein [Azospirillum cavernae]